MALLALELNGAVVHNPLGGRVGNDLVVAVGVAAVDRMRCRSDSGSIRRLSVGIAPNHLTVPC